MSEIYTFVSHNRKNMKSDWLRQLAEITNMDVDKTLDRFLNNEKLFLKFLLKFQNDQTFESLESSIEAGDAQTAFSCAHTLKGIAGNLGFDNLYAPLTSLTEILRSGELKKAAEHMPEISRKYAETISFLKTLTESKAG